MGKKKKTKSKNNRPSLTKFIKESNKDNVQSENQVIEYPNIDKLIGDVFYAKDSIIKSPSLKSMHNVLLVDKKGSYICLVPITTSDGRSGQNYGKLPSGFTNRDDSWYERELMTINKRKTKKSDDRNIAKIVYLDESCLVGNKKNIRDLTDREKKQILEDLNKKNSNRKKYFEWNQYVKNLEK